MPAKRPPARRVAPAAAAPRAPTPDEGLSDVVGRCRVLSGGISTPAGAVYRGAIVTATDLGDDARVQKLLSSGSIEEVTDD